MVRSSIIKVQVIHRTEINSQKVIDLIQTVRKIEPVQLTLFYPTKGYTTNEYFINKGNHCGWISIILRRMKFRRFSS